jgi:hypothetical protein
MPLGRWRLLVLPHLLLLMLVVVVEHVLLV